jgi:hypothetical protein
MTNRPREFPGIEAYGFDPINISTLFREYGILLGGSSGSSREIFGMRPLHLSFEVN